MYSGQLQLIDSEISSISSDRCENCSKLTRKNKKLIKENKELKQGFSQEGKQGKLSDVSVIGTELLNFKALAKEYKIEMEDLTSAITYALDKMFMVKSKALVEKGKNILQMIDKLFTPNPKQRETFTLQPRLQPQQDQITQINKKSVNPVSKKPVKAQNERILQIQRQSQLDQTKSIRLGREQRLVERRKITSKGDQSNNSKSYSYQDISIPLIWENSSAFKVSEKIITKLYDDTYKKMCNQTSLPRSGSHKLKFQMIRKGTVAFGIVLQQYKNKKMVNDQNGAVKYLSFSNGGGLLKFYGEQLLKDKKLHLLQGQILQILFDAQKLQVTFKNPNLNEPIPIQLTETFKNKQLYFFIEMKDKNCAVKML